MGSAIQPEDEDMKIGIVGAGQIGGTLTRRLTALGQRFLSQTREVPKRSPTWPPKPARPLSRSQKPFATSILSWLPFLKRIF